MVKSGNNELILPTLERKEERQARGETDTTREEPNWSFGLRTMPRCNYRTAPVSVAHQPILRKTNPGKASFFFLDCPQSVASRPPVAWTAIPNHRCRKTPRLHQSTGKAGRHGARSNSAGGGSLAHLPRLSPGPPLPQRFPLFFRQTAPQVRGQE
jgi:hypothetical protein